MGSKDSLMEEISVESKSEFLNMYNKDNKENNEYKDNKDNLVEEISLEKKSELFRKMLRDKTGKGKGTISQRLNEISNIKELEKMTEFDYSQIPEEYCKFELFPEYRSLVERKNSFEIENVQMPYFRANDSTITNNLRIGNKEYISYSSFNYLGYSGDKRVIDAAIEACLKYGTSASASRLLTGEKIIHGELDKEISQFLDCEDAITFVGGHTTNLNTIGHLMRPQDLIVYDYLSHNSITQGCQLSGARKIPFAHNDYEQLEEILKANRKDFERTLIAIEGVYSQDGDIPNLSKIIELKKRYKAFLIIDEAHSIGVIGNTGRGIGEHFNVNRRDVDIWMGTISKSLGSCGGYIAGSYELIDYLKFTAPGFIYATGMSPQNAGAALEALRILKTEPWRVKKLQKNGEFFLNYAKEKGLDTGLSSGTPIIPVIIGNSISCIKLSNNLFEHGIVVNPILFPAVPKNAARLRFFVTSEHTEEQMRYTLDTLAEYLPR